MQFKSYSRNVHRLISINVGDTNIKMYFKEIIYHTSNTYFNSGYVEIMPILRIGR